MHLDTRYRLLLDLTNVIIKQTTPTALFRSVAEEMAKLVVYDRLSINIYDPQTDTLSYFAAAAGITPAGISGQDSRPLAQGSIAQLVIRSGRPLIAADLDEYRALPSVEAMLSSGLTATMAFPLITRNQILGTIHLSFKQAPASMVELQGFIADLSAQVAIAVDNMLAHEKLKTMNKHLERQKRYLQDTVDRSYSLGEFFYADPSMMEIMRQVELVADSDVPVLITGETGTGKDYIAHRLHYLSRRRDQLLVKLNCAALPDSLIESELFGHAKGAFTGATARRVGRFELADGGTVFLDEIGETTPRFQAKLLQVLQDGTFERVGESRPAKADVRIIAATNQDLSRGLEEGRFRPDLYYRLSGLTIGLPPLRERWGDVSLLVEGLTAAHAREINRTAPFFTPEALKALTEYHWPGNVRELKNLVKRLVLLRPGQVITESDVSSLISPFQKEAGGQNFTLVDAERRCIQAALRRCGGVLGGPHGAAKLLGLPRSTLQYRIKRLGLTLTRSSAVRREI